MQPLLTRTEELKKDAGQGKIGTVAGIRQLEVLHLAEFARDLHELAQVRDNKKPQKVKRKSTQDTWKAPSLAENNKVCVALFCLCL